MLAAAPYLPGQGVPLLPAARKVLAGAFRIDGLACRVDQDITEEAACQPQSRGQQRVVAVEDVGAVEVAGIHVGQVEVRLLVGVDGQDHHRFILHGRLQLGQERLRPIEPSVAIGDINEDHDRLAAKVAQCDPLTGPGYALQRRRRRLGSLLLGRRTRGRKGKNDGDRAHASEFHGVSSAKMAG